MNAGGLGKTYADGQGIIKQGETGDCMFAIQSGRVEVVKVDKDGEVRVAVLEEGDIFGEMAIFEREVRSASVRALGEARVLTVDKKTFLRRVQEDPSIAFNLVRMLSRRIRRLSTEVAGLKAEKGEKTTPASEEEDWHLRDRRRGAERRSGRERRAGVERRGRQ
ncbi:MAG: cyclic nucleotide-binding domain-containing protein [Betaproteobacteria bacterium]|nr:cyclic nucleotide-binding domain-containing protein [Betaproteobacteria bacterium]